MLRPSFHLFLNFHLQTRTNLYIIKNSTTDVLLTNVHLNDHIDFIHRLKSIVSDNITNCELVADLLTPIADLLPNLSR